LVSSVELHDAFLALHHRKLSAWIFLTVSVLDVADVLWV
jgi:hypothetical protein